MLSKKLNNLIKIVGTVAAFCKRTIAFLKGAQFKQADDFDTIYPITRSWMLNKHTQIAADAITIEN